MERRVRTLSFPVVAVCLWVQVVTAVLLPYCCGRFTADGDVAMSSADTHTGELRLSWHLDQSVGGYRVGNLVGVVSVSHVSHYDRVAGVLECTTHWRGTVPTVLGGAGMVQGGAGRSSPMQPNLGRLGAACRCVRHRTSRARYTARRSPRMFARASRTAQPVLGRALLGRPESTAHWTQTQRAVIWT